MNITGVDGYEADIFDYLMQRIDHFQPTALWIKDVRADAVARRRIDRAGARGMMTITNGTGVHKHILKNPWEKAGYDPELYNRRQREQRARRRARIGPEACKKRTQELYQRRKARLRAQLQGAAS